LRLPEQPAQSTGSSRCQIRNAPLDNFVIPSLPAAQLKEVAGENMFFVVGLTFEDVSSGALPQVRLADALKARGKQGVPSPQPARRIVVYTTFSTNTQGLSARTKYRDKGAFLVFLYFSDGAVEICKEQGIPLRILDQIEERDLPGNKVTVLEDPWLTTFSLR
jgi:hypothetical protein